MAPDGGVPEAALLVLGELPDEATVTALAREIRVSWPEAEPTAGSAVAGYEVQWRSGSEDWDTEARRVVIGLSYVIGGLDDGVAYTVRVRPAAVETASVSGASITAGEGSAPMAEIPADAPALPGVYQSVSTLSGPVNFEMNGEPVWPATVEIPVDMSLVGDDVAVQFVYYNENLEQWLPVPGATLDRGRGVMTAEMYHLSIGDVACSVSPIITVLIAPCNVADVVSTTVSYVERIRDFVSDHWEPARGWLKSGWHRAQDFVFNDIPELARQVLERAEQAGTTLAPWVAAWLKAVTQYDQIAYLGSTLVSRFGYDIDPPRCDGDTPSWATPSREEPDKDILLRCDETAAGSVVPGRDDLGVKLTVNRTYALSLKPSLSDMRRGTGFGDPSEHISVDETDWPASLEDLVGKGINTIINPNSIFLPPASTTNLRIPYISMPGQSRESSPEPGAAYQTITEQRTTELNYEVDTTSTLMQMLLLLLEGLTHGGSGAVLKTSKALLHVVECASPIVAGIHNTRDVLDLKDAVRDIYDDCVVESIPYATPRAGPALLALGAVVLLHEYGRMVADGMILGPDHSVIIESRWRDRTVTGESFVVSAGDGHTCIVRTGNAIQCWGLNAAGQAEAPDGAYNAVSTGSGHSCGLRTNGTIECWGNNSFGQARASGHKFVAVAAGHWHSCGLRTNGTIECWGNNDGGQTDVPEGEFWTVAAGALHSCGLHTDWTITCWGSNTDGQTDAPEGRFWTVAAGDFHSCGLTTEYWITCWGNNDHGQSDDPARLFSFRTVTAGKDHTCGMRGGALTANLVSCWGNNDHGQTDAPGERFKAVSAGSGYTCGQLLAGDIQCWGRNNNDQTNIPPDLTDTETPPDGPSPTSIASSRGNSSAVTAGGRHSCGLRSDNTITCWGNNDSRQVDAPAGTFKVVTVGWIHSCGLRTDDTITCWGNNEFGESDAPAGTFKAVFAGDYHSCGLRTDGTIACWGADEFGQLSAPAGTFKSVTAGDYHTCGLRTDDTIACWGADEFGQLSAPAGTFKSVTAGFYHSCGLRTDDTVACWGADEFGHPSAPAGTFKSVTSSGVHTCGLRTDDTVTCWGADALGQTDAPAGTFKAIATRVVHSCGLRTDNTVACWGNNRFGQTDAPAGTFKAVAVGGEHSCGLRTDDTVICWGNNEFGQADSPTEALRPVGEGQGAVTLSRGGLGPTTLSAGEGVPCALDTPTCRYLNVELNGFAAGTYTVECRHDGWSDFGPSTFWTFSITVGDSGTASSQGPCFINLARLTGNGTYVTVSGPGTETVASNWVK